MGKTWFLFGVVVVILLNCFMSSSTNLTTNYDEFSLLAFKSHLTLDPQNILATNWSTTTTTTSICNWIGVVCSFPNRRVISLNLSNMSLSGTIAPHLGNLSFLDSLDLSYNSFHGIIPTEICNLPNLVHLRLRYNNLTGSIPRSLFNISSLTSVDLTANDLYDVLPVDMCTHLTSLEGLFLSVNRLHGQIPTNIYKCRKLQRLSLSFNEFYGRIPREIGNMTMLEELYLGINSFTGIIPKEMGNLAHLEIVSIQSASLTGSIPSSIFNISSLRTVHFPNNSLSGSLPLDIHSNVPRLENVYLKSNQFSGNIPSSLWECRTLRVLSLSNNKFTGHISKKIGNLSLLQELHLDINNLTGGLPEEIGSLNLEIFVASENHFTGLIPFKIFNISTLEALTLRDNDFSGQLPLSMGLWLPNLVTLVLDSNKLSGVIPNSIGNASKLTLLGMSTNSFSGFIPDTLGNLRLLSQLLLAENNLTIDSSTLELRFFSSLSNCRNLMSLELSLNQLNCVLPNSLGNLSTSLVDFGAFGCKLKGSIPSGIGNLSSLGIINLDNNEFTGFIPKSLGRLNRLSRLYLEHNRLQGYIPRNLCQVMSLEHIYLNSNMLRGPIPACLGEVKSLRHVFLDSNRLNSTIPLSLWDLKDLVALNLSSNILSGYIPSSGIESLKVITQIDLSRNQLSGNIPSNIGGFRSLVYLSLADNDIQGPIPQSLDTLINLEFLDLSDNNLSGVIPKSLEELRYLQYLNLSFNRLQGEIPTGGHFANFTAQSFMNNDALCGAPRLQVPPCRNGTLKQSKLNVLPLLQYILPPISSAILAVALAYVLIRWKKRNRNLLSHSDLSTRPLRRISYYELLQATDEFSDSNLLGTGSFGAVYKGTLSDEVIIAVKVFNLQIEGAFKSFDVECEIMCNIRHRNLVRIISSCANLDLKCLVLEYMANGSLDKWLYSHNNYMDILQRMNIMIDVASAVEYLHHGLTTPIVHCDLKPSNVLLDEDMIAHVGDFGISKLFGEGEFMTQTRTLATIGYMAPEYGTEGIITTKGDVYSFGILLIEMFTRKKPTDEMFVGELSLKSWVSNAFALHGSITEVVDSNLIIDDDVHHTAKQDCVSSVLRLAMDCLSDLPNDRISMEDASARLKKIKVQFSATTEADK